tara:strand:- start:3690 stop:4259 length:570 start_codon:yes stop_codon:yes gene_type:complete
MNPRIAEINQKGLFPIPGQSLTADPSDPAPYERPPEFTNPHEAVRSIWSNLIEEDTYVDIIRLLDNKVPLLDLVKGMLFIGFQEGKWDSNLMMLLAEPLIYMLLALAERAGVEPIFEDEDLEIAEDYEEETKNMTFAQRMESQKLKDVERDITNIPEGVVPEEIMEDIQEIPQEKIDSLLAERKSLLDK